MVRNPHRVTSSGELVLISTFLVRFDCMLVNGCTLELRIAEFCGEVTRFGPWVELSIRLPTESIMECCWLVCALPSYGDAVELIKLSRFLLCDVTWERLPF